MRSIIADERCQDNSCIYKLFCYDGFCLNYLSDKDLLKELAMGTSTVTQKIPAGTYAGDALHSSIGFAVVHNGVSTFRSGFRAYEARLEGGEEARLEGTGEGGSRDHDEEGVSGPPLPTPCF